MIFLCKNLAPTLITSFVSYPFQQINIMQLLRARACWVGILQQSNKYSNLVVPNFRTLYTARARLPKLNTEGWCYVLQVVCTHHFEDTIAVHQTKIAENPSEPWYLEVGDSFSLRPNATPRKEVKVCDRIITPMLI